MPCQPRVPTQADFHPLSKALTIALHYPSPPASTTTILLLFHGLGDSHLPFLAWSKAVDLPNTLCISVRGVNPLPSALLDDFPSFISSSSSNNGRVTELSEDAYNHNDNDDDDDDDEVNRNEEAGPGHWIWGDDVEISTATGELDPDPGFEKAYDLVMTRLIHGVLIGACGWNLDDILLFGFGQGGSLALSLAARVAADAKLKGVVSIGGPLPPSSVVKARERKHGTPVLLCHGTAWELEYDDAADVMRKEFESVREVRWKKPGDGMPVNREEMLPIMEFFAERIR